MQANRNKAKYIIYGGGIPLLFLCSCRFLLQQSRTSSVFPKAETCILSVWLSYSLFLLGEEEKEVNNFCFPSVSSSLIASSQGKRRWTMLGPCSFFTVFSFSSPKDGRGKWQQALNIHSSFQSSSLTTFAIQWHDSLRLVIYWLFNLNVSSSGSQKMQS